MAKIDHAAIRTASYENAQKFLKMYLKCICGERAVKNREENAGTKKESSSAKWKKLTQREKMATTTFQSRWIPWKKRWKRSRLIR